ncbi:hypothetical protein Tco_1420896 [Tanacetum coccineum]
MVANTIDFVTSVLSQRDLDLFYITYNISADLRPKLPGRDDTIQNSPEGKIGIYTRFIEFAYFRIPLSRFLLFVLQYYQINFSQLSVLGAAKVCHFEIKCRVLGYQPSLGTFRRFYVNSISNGWLSFSRHGPTWCCFSKKFDSLKGWNDHFFWIDASIFPIFVSWYNDVLVRRYPLPSDNLVDFELLEKLASNRTVIKQYPETFLCLVGLSRSFDDLHVCSTLLKSDESDICLLDFVKSTDPFKVKTGERTLAEGEVSLLIDTADMVVAPTVQTIRLVDHTIVNELEEHDGKKKRKVVFNPPSPPCLSFKAGRRVLDLSPFRHPSEEIMSSVTPTPEGDVPEDSGLSQDLNDQAHCPPNRYVVVTSNSEHGDVNIDGSPKAKSPSPHVEVKIKNAKGVAVDNFAHNVYVPEWDVTNNNAWVDNPALCRNLLDHITPPRMDAKIVALKAKLEIAEKESTEVSGLYGRVSKLEAEVVAKFEEITGLNKQNVELLGKVSVLESAREELTNQVSKLAAQHFEEQSAKLDARIADVRREIDTDLYPYMLTAIARQRWILGHGIRLAVMKCAQSSECHFTLGKVISLAINKGIQQGLEAGIEHGKAGRSLAQVETYDPEVENKYVAAVGEFENVSFSLLEELEALKDSPLAFIMSALTLEGDADSTPELRKLQPSLDQVTIPVYYESDGSRGFGSISHEMLLSDAIPAIRGRAERRGLGSSSGSATDGAAANVPAQDSSLVVADYQISTLTLTDDFIPVTQPHDDLFDTTVLDKPVDP